MLPTSFVTNFFTALVKNYDNQEIEFYQDKAGDIWLTAEQIGIALGYAQPRKSVLNIYRRHRRLLENFQGVIKLMTPGGEQAVTVFYEIAVNFIALKANTPKANDFALWVAKIIKEYRDQNLIHINAIAPLSDRLRNMHKVLFELEMKVDSIFRAMPLLRFDSELDNLLALRPFKVEEAINKMKKEALTLADSKSELSTGDCAKVFNVKPSTIRKWIKKGLLTDNTWSYETNARKRITICSVLNRIEKLFLRRHN